MNSPDAMISVALGLSKGTVSIPFFFGARLDADIRFLDLPPERLPKRVPRQRPRQSTVPQLLKSRLRSHPDAAQRHYADILETAAA
ncbi:MAG: hypothetical protein E5Y65_31370 [Mesorhizobium sp.]|uniref:Uncharacterized protein n=2 Tax=Mesorhizobium TaxID=68287 RepID=A0A271KNT5_9HYPH|nr:MULTISPECIES: hypothetical protein [Mesorhizobium]RUV98019.1 hypothetical protein EOA88_00765 [Mesorhizobium sp. M5C.F.Ca.IN.020.14.1.1]AZO19665.1 hypothetical protein EJ070_02515 [Mesorhizobium sp. M1E.F.Ca.ET.045.02.1.1]MDF3170279.1 hypothetical protein [Mesorhizobium sp. P16.1]MDF3180877.1 hypothetical protein [Mesorhizobium sp. P17.1]MDF3187153.1 hypothetical protein [Mesorhizobium sp. ICCV3110.1]